VIFVTVGAQMPFDRLIKTVDDWAMTRNEDNIFFQIGASEFRPTSMQWTKFLTPSEFNEKFSTAKVVVSHAGTGSIITALQLGKPILIMPRKADLRETRNDHQIATAKRFQQFPSVAVAWDELDLAKKLDKLGEISGKQTIGNNASPELLSALREFVTETHKNEKP